MGFYKLLKGELNKILMRPILYIITAVIVLAIIFSYFQFDPKTKDDYSALHSVYSSQDTLAKVNKTFNDPIASNKFGAIASDQLIIQAENELEKAKARTDKTEPGERDILEYINYLIGEHRSQSISEPDDFLSAYQTYMNEQNFKDSSVIASIDALANVVGPIRTSQTSEFINPTPVHESNNLVAIHTYITGINDIQKLKNTLIDNPNIIVPTEKITRFNEIYIEIYNKVISDDRPSEYDITKIENHASIRKLFRELDLYSELCSFVDSIKIKSVSDQIYEERQANIEEAKTYLSSLKTEISTLAATNDEKNLNQLKDLCYKYYIYSLNVSRLITNTTNYDAVLKMGDKEASAYYGYNIMSISSSGDSLLYLYAVDEVIAKQVYMLNTHTVETDYATVFNGVIASTNAGNAFDFVYFGLEIVSIVIIIFTIVLAAGMLAGEQSNGTLKLLLIRPYSRRSILTSKLLATLIFAAIFFVFSTIVLFLIGWALYGVSFTPVLAVFNGTQAFAISPTLLLLIYLLCLLFKTLFYVVISLAISAIFRSNVGAVSISIVLYFLISIMGTIFATSYIYGFIPFSNLDLFKFFGGSFVATGQSSLISTIFSSSVFHGVGFWYSFISNLILIVLITMLSYLIFRKREIK